MQSSSASFKYKNQLHDNGRPYTYPHNGIYFDDVSGLPVPEQVGTRYGAMSAYFETRAITWTEISGAKSEIRMVSRSFPWQNGKPEPVDNVPAGGKALWWLDGLGAIGAGTPGRGGDSGTLTTLRDVAGTYVLAGGAAGTRGVSDTGDTGYCNGGRHGMHNYTAMGPEDYAYPTVRKVFQWSHYSKPFMGNFVGYTYWGDGPSDPAWPLGGGAAATHLSPYGATEVCGMTVKTAAVRRFRTERTVPPRVSTC